MLDRIEVSIRLPILFTKPDECCGCSACCDVCPLNAIIMMPDSEGFLYPRINDQKCINCKRCIKVCPMK